jgi:hypothetical protein
VVGVAAELSAVPTAVRRPRLRRAPAAEALQVDVPLPDVAADLLGAGPWHAARPGKAADVHERLDAGRVEEGGEAVRLVRGVAYREDARDG